MPLHPQAKMILDGMNAMGLSLFTPGMTADDMRRQTDERRVPAVGDPEMAKTEDRTVPGPDGNQIPVRIYWPSAAPGPHPVVVFFHGGGWVICNIETHDSLCKQLAAQSGCVFVSVDYRLAPEYKFPAAPEDCYAVTKWVAENAPALGVDASRLAVAGDSAGGNLAAAVPQMARDRGGPAIAFQLLIYPVTDFDASRPSMRDNAEGYMLTTDAMAWFYDQYLPESDRTNPYAAPIKGDLSNLPPAMVITAEYDPLRDEGNDYAAKLIAAGVKTEHQCVPGMIHGFFSMHAALDDAKAAQAAAAKALKSALI